jgi:hypothetical protein
VSAIASRQTEHGPDLNLDQDIQKVPSALMHFAEYFMAVKSIIGPPHAKVVIVDRQLAIDIPHLISEAMTLLDETKCILEGMETENGIISKLDLDLGRMLHPNSDLKIPAARSQFIKYAVINEMISRTKNKKMHGGIKELLEAVGAKKEREKKLLKDLQKYNDKYSIFENKFKVSDVEGDDSDLIEDFDDTTTLLKLKPGTEQYWERIFSSAMKLGEHIFNTPENEHPLLIKRNNSSEEKVWITVNDIQYMTLIMIYTLVRLAWEKNILIIGLVKDIGAAELTKTIIPVLQEAKMITIKNMLPNFGSDKMLLQVNSLMDPFVKTPWRTFEFDSCFRTMVPERSDDELIDTKKSDGKKIKKIALGYGRVKGAYKNLVSQERMFVKAYIQLWGSETDHTVKSHVFSYDRPCYPGYDIVNPELLLFHNDGNVDEEITPVIHFKNDSQISHLVMSILFTMSQEVIPEAIGHNYPLFIADKKAKKMLFDAEPAYISILSLELTKHSLEQQILFESKFRDYRSRIENKRRKNKAK